MTITCEFLERLSITCSWLQSDASVYVGKVSLQCEASGDWAHPVLEIFTCTAFTNHSRLLYKCFMWVICIPILEKTVHIITVLPMRTENHVYATVYIFLFVFTCLLPHEICVWSVCRLGYVNCIKWISVKTWQTLLQADSCVFCNLKLFYHSCCVCVAVNQCKCESWGSLFIV